MASSTSTYFKELLRAALFLREVVSDSLDSLDRTVPALGSLYRVVDEFPAGSSEVIVIAATSVTVDVDETIWSEGVSFTW